MKRFFLIFVGLLIVVSPLCGQRNNNGARNTNYTNRNNAVCINNCDAGCSLCYMEDPRAARYKGLTYPKYYQGYPYYGYYPYGSSMGHSYAF